MNKKISLKEKRKKGRGEKKIKIFLLFCMQHLLLIFLELVS
jgi:hypothetical protein